MKTLIYRCIISRKALQSVPLRNQIESTDLQVFYQPEGVSLRFYPQPEANAFRLIQPNHCNNYDLFDLLSGTLSNALRLVPNLISTQH